MSRARARRRHGPAARADDPRHPGPRRASRATIFHSARWDHDYDLDAASASPSIGTGASAIQFVPADPAEGRAAARLPAHRAVGHAAPDRPDPALERASTGASRRSSGAMRARHLLGARAVRAPCFAARLATAARARSGARTCARRSPTRSCARSSRPTTARLQAHPALERLPPRSRKPNVEVVTDGVAEVREHSIVDRRRHRARGRRDHLRHRLPRHRHADRRARPRRATARRWPSAGTAARRPTGAPRSPGFPNLFFLLGPNTGLGHTSMVFMVESQVALRARRAAPPARARARDRSTSAARPQQRYNADIQRRMKGTVWTDGRLRELVPRPQRPQLVAVAGLHLPLRRRAAPLRPRRAHRPAGEKPRPPRWRRELMLSAR